MKMVSLFVVSIFSFIVVGWSQHQRTKISFAIDHREHLIPHTKHNYTSYVAVHILRKIEDLKQNFDLVTHADFKVLKLLFKNANLPLPSYLQHNDHTIELFESKTNWKEWMNSIGLGSHVPVTYNINNISTIQYPVVLKTNEHNGHGVYVAENEQQLHSMVDVIARKSNENENHDSTFTAEEALTGMGLSEAVSFGSAYKGRVVSLRCMIRNFEHDKAALSAHHGHDKHQSQSMNSTVFIKGKALHYDSQFYTPCSKELVNLTQTMFAHLPPYTGGFCSDIKMDSHGKFKLMETNARFCYSMRTVEEIFLSTYVPLSFAVQEQLPVHARAAWVNMSHLVHFYRQEQDVLRTGGGISGGTLISVDKFDPSLRVDAPKYVADAIV